MIKTNVKKMMDNRDLTIQEVASKTKMAHTTIIRARTDSGIRGCSLATLETIARALDVSVKDLFDDDITEDPHGDGSESID